MRADCHIHIDKIGGPHKTTPPTVESFILYANREQASLFFTIYESDQTLSEFQSAGFDLVPIYWERNPLVPSIPNSARGIKLHPYIENYKLTVENVQPTLAEARLRNLFIFVHTDDRTPELSRGSLVANLASEYQDLVFIMAHSGSYAPQNPVKPGESSVHSSLVRELVTESVEVARAYENIYLETSILASDIKAEILSRAPLSKLLIGSDFPISEGAECTSLRFQEAQLMRYGLNESDLQRIHQNAASFFSGRVVTALG